MRPLKIINVNLQSGIGITKGWYQYVTEHWKWYFPHSQSNILKAAEFFNNERPDIIFVTEIDAGSARSNYQNQIDFIKNKTGGEVGFFQTVNWLNIYNMGCAIFTPHKILNTVVHELPGTGERRILGEVTLSINGKEVKALVTHLSLRKSARKEQLETIVNIVSGKSGPKILAGDFNTYNGEEIKVLEKAGLLKYAAGATFPSWKPTRNLDYIFVSDEFNIISTTTFKKELFSDHLPLITEIEIS